MILFDTLRVRMFTWLFWPTVCPRLILYWRTPINISRPQDSTSKRGGTAQSTARVIFVSWGGSINGGTRKWKVYHGTSQSKMDDLEVHLCQVTSSCHYIHFYVGHLPMCQISTSWLVGCLFHPSNSCGQLCSSWSWSLRVCIYNYYIYIYICLFVSLIYFWFVNTIYFFIFKNGTL